MPLPAARFVRLLAMLALAIGASGCTNPQMYLRQLLEARRLASELHLEFTKAAEAATRAVMADTDDASHAAADEARRARQVVELDIDALRTALQSLGYNDELHMLDGFNARFAEYREVDDEILPLAVENTNLKAQRLAFGPAQEAADTFGAALDASVRAGATGGSCCAEAIAARALTGVLAMQVLQAPHIAESDDAAMTRMEDQMKASAERARRGLDQLRRTRASSDARLTAAGAALDRFLEINTEIVALSRRNTNVRSLALSLGRKRTATAACEDRLRELEEALSKHQFNATR